MKSILTTLAFLLLCSLYAISADRYWVGQMNGKWSDAANWSDVAGGTGGASVPGPLDTVRLGTQVFGQPDTQPLIHVDNSPTISTLIIGRSFVTLHASTPVIFTILDSMSVPVFTTLLDSTSTDVPFTVVFSGSTRARGNIYGDWIFSGRVPVNRSAGSGAGFTAQPGSQVRITPRGSDQFQFPAPAITFRNNTNYISSDPGSLRFFPGSRYILENNLDGSIPNATWAGDSVISRFNRPTLFNPSSIRITGLMEKLTHLSPVTGYKDVFVNLPGQLTDVSLNIPDGTTMNGNISIENTNNRTLTLLSESSPGSSVSVALVYSFDNTYSAGGLFIGGNSKVAMASATSSSAATSYTLQVVRFGQSGGIFSLQDYNNSSGSNTLAVRGTFTQTGGTFITNSSSTTSPAKFFVDMNGPQSVFQGTATGGNQISQAIEIRGATTVNDIHRMTLKISNSIIPGINVSYNGVNLLSPLQVGRLEMNKGTLNTTSANTITVLDPDVNAVTVNPAEMTFVNGPMRRWTNSPGTYTFPIGSGSRPSQRFPDSCLIMPGSSAPSLYQAEYFRAAYPNLAVSSPLKGVSNTEYWNIEKISGADAVVKLVVNAPGVPGAAATDAIVAAHFVNGQWVAEHGTTLTPGNDTTGSVLSKQLSTFGPFTFGYADSASLNTEPGTGLNYKYYEGSFNALPDFNTLTPVKSGNSSNIDLSVRTPGRDDNFAFVWEGYIRITTPGSYTFETISDDGSKLYFNSLYNAYATPTVNNDGLHAPTPATGTVYVSAAGLYPISITFFEKDGGEQMQVYWTGPGISRQLIPNSAFMGMPSSSGLTYKYYEFLFTPWTSLPDFNTLTPVKTGNSANINLGVRSPGKDDNFAFVWQGRINIITPGVYTFETISDDGSKLYFNSAIPSGTPTVDNDGLHAPRSASGSVNITAAGFYPISITFFEKDGGEQMQVYWTGPGIVRQLIPDYAFTPTPPVTSGLTYRYYEGTWSMLPDFSMLTPVKTGSDNNVDLSVRTPGRDDLFGFVWEGYIRIQNPGIYIFETISDDGSKLYFNAHYNASATATVNNDGLHAPVSATGMVDVSSAGTYPIAMTYFEKFGGEHMQVYWTGPGIPRQRIPDSVFTLIAPVSSPPVTKARRLTGNDAGLEEKNALSTRVFPNPFKEDFNIEFYNPAPGNEIHVSLYDIKGKLVYMRRAGKVPRGNARVNVDMDGQGLPPGIYMAQLTINGVPSKMAKLVKIR